MSYEDKKGAMSSSVNAHKAMAGATQSGNFGVKPMPSSGRGMHADASSHVGMKGPLDDAMRGAPPAVGSMKGIGAGMQAAPDHGPMGQDHYKRGGKI